MSNERKPESLEEVYRWLCDGGWVICKGDPVGYTLRLYDGQFQYKERLSTIWIPMYYGLPTRLSDVRALIPAEVRETLWQPVWSHDAKKHRDTSFWHTEPRLPGDYFGSDPVGWLKQTRVNGKCVDIEYVPGEVGE
jgi:hypothetical protein